MYRFFLFILLTVFFSCIQQTEKEPTNLLSEVQMIEALTDIHLLESAVKLNLIEGLKNDSLTLIDGKKVKELEKTVSKIFGKKYGLMVNSGSSANLLALSSFKFKKGSEVITPNLTFSTTVAPIYQLGLIPHFVGVEKNKFITDTKQIEKSINKKTVAIMIPNLL